MPIEVEHVLERHETSIKEIHTLIAEREVSYQVFVNDVKHLTGLVKELVATTKCMQGIISGHTTHLQEIKKFQESRIKVYKFLSKHGWKIIGVAVALATTFDIVRQLPHK